MASLTIPKIGTRCVPLVRYARSQLRHVPAAMSAATTTNPARSFASEPVPEEDYYDGHLMVDRLEYLNDMIEKTISIESQLQELKETYNEKRQKAKSLMSESSSKSKAADAEDMQVLFDRAAAQKDQISCDLERLRSIMVSAASTGGKSASFAVDGPDGTSDGQVRESVDEVRKIIDRSSHFDRDAIKGKTFAVDGPDGTSDDQLANDDEVVERIVESAAEHEDSDAIKLRHNYENAVTRDRIRDPEHDW